MAQVITTEDENKIPTSDSWLYSLVGGLEERRIDGDEGDKIVLGEWTMEEAARAFRASQAFLSCPIM